MACFFNGGGNSLTYKPAESRRESTSKEKMDEVTQLLPMTWPSSEIQGRERGKCVNIILV